MDKHGIGTDATHAEHIDKIKTRTYVQMNRENRFEPTFLGLALVDCYQRMGRPEFSKPNLRADLEKELVRITEGKRFSIVWALMFRYCKIRATQYCLLEN